MPQAAATSGASSGTCSRAGGQGSVVVSSWQKQPAAFKTITRSSVRTVAAEDKMAHLSGTHPHITKVLARGTNQDGDFTLVLELAVGDFLDVLHRTPERRTYESGYAREWFLQVAHALKHVHELGIAHRDIKPENILVFAPSCLDKTPCTPAIYNSAQSLLLDLASKAQCKSKASLQLHESGFIAKITDWGSAYFTPAAEADNPRGRSARGSTLYSSPEVQMIHMLCTGKPQGAAGITREALWSSETAMAAAVKEAQNGYCPFKSDVWSFGITVYAMVGGRAPFSAATPASSAFRAFVRATQPHVLQDITMAPECDLWEGDSTRGDSVWSWPASFSPALRDLLRKCLAVRAEERCSMDDVKNHPWFRDPSWSPDSLPSCVSMGSEQRNMSAEPSLTSASQSLRMTAAASSASGAGPWAADASRSASPGQHSGSDDGAERATGLPREADDEGDVCFDGAGLNERDDSASPPSPLRAKHVGHSTAKEFERASHPQFRTPPGVSATGCSSGEWAVLEDVSEDAADAEGDVTLGAAQQPAARATPGKTPFKSSVMVPFSPPREGAIQDPKASGTSGTPGAVVASVVSSGASPAGSITGTGAVKPEAFAVIPGAMAAAL